MAMDGEFMTHDRVQSSEWTPRTSSKRPGERPISSDERRGASDIVGDPQCSLNFVRHPDDTVSGW
jgi:hypothetical protein